MEVPLDHIQIITALIYTVALFYSIITFKHSKRLDQITFLGEVTKGERGVDREPVKIPL